MDFHRALCFLYNALINHISSTQLYSSFNHALYFLYNVLYFLCLHQQRLLHLNLPHLLLYFHLHLQGEPFSLNPGPFKLNPTYTICYSKPLQKGSKTILQRGVPRKPPNPSNPFRIIQLLALQNNGLPQDPIFP
jgi:hypothetical protein